MAKTEFKTIAQNKKAYHDYFVEETLEAGIELCGTEVKSLRQGRCNLKDAWCSVVDGEMLLNGCHISPYEKGSRVKVQVGLCKGKKLYDKRADMAARDAQRDIQRALKEKNR